MGTFHRDPHPLHGITCVVDTKGPRVYVGRVDRTDEGGLVLLDVDVFDEKPGGESKAAYLDRAFRVGTWKKYDRLTVPSAEIATVRRLADVATPPRP
jgi:hypothetical protein